MSENSRKSCVAKHNPVFSFLSPLFSLSLSLSLYVRTIIYCTKRIYKYVRKIARRKSV